MFKHQEVSCISLTKPTKKFPKPEGNAEDIISYCARVSNPSNQENFDTAGKLLRYCIRKKHWSIFEMADATMEIKTTRDIGRQILRHRSSSFQEFSQRYAYVDEMFIEGHREGRLQDNKNRQNSLENTNSELLNWWYTAQDEVLSLVEQKYKEATSKGIAKECARVLLPEGLTMSTMYMKNSVRGWFHYCQVRKDESTQEEHRDIANKVWEELIEEMPFLKEIEVMEP